MKAFRALPTLAILSTVWCLATAGAATTRYVWQDSPSPAPPYTGWTTAAHDIQNAVDAALAGDTVLVAGGVYATGGRAVYGTMTNRVAIDRAITVESLMGPEVTIIQGYQVPGTTNGDSAIRCVYLTNGAALSGFTLTNGATRSAGDFSREQCGGGVWCGSMNALVTNCIVAGNSATFNGGGAYDGTLNNCTLTGNSALQSGGGVCYGTLNNCTLTGNSALQSGGGVDNGTLNNCTVTGNSAGSGGGGTSGGTLNNCTFTGNSAQFGGGASSGTLNNCTVTGNSAGSGGGGTSGGTLNNCTLTGNSATGGDGSGGGAHGGTLNNCILYYNTAISYPNYHDDYGTNLNYCCTTPLPGSGTGNISAEPQLASAFHLSANSPCRGAGSAAYATGVDIDGEPWLTPPSIGCDEYRAGALTGALTVAISASSTYVATGFAVDLTGLISGRVSASAWDFGDGTVLSNRPCASHAWTSAGNYQVVLRAYNDTYPGGVSATVTVRVAVQPVHYVSAASANPVAPYASWATAAQTLQQAADVAMPGALVLVANGVYATGGRAVYGTMTNRLAVGRAVTVRSVNGPAVTVIQGYQVPGTTNGDGAIRCVYLTNGAALSGFTLTNGATRSAGDAAREQYGGGVWCESTNAFVTNCIVARNSASYGGGAYQGTLNNCTLTGNSAAFGGGASLSTLNNCTLTGNSAGSGGGGAFGGTLNNCTLTANSAAFGGGACGLSSQPCTLNNCTLTGNFATGQSGSGGGVYGGSLNNCILYYNTANSNPNYYDPYGTNLNYCCTTPLPTGGTGNLATEPQLVSASRLSTGSPCRGAGSAAYATGLDIDGEPWLNPPSIGCDEYRAGALTGDLTVTIGATWTNVAAGYAVDFTAWIGGRASASVWVFGDGTILSNRPYASHAWVAPGDYAVVLRAYNETHREGVSATVTIRVVTAVHYVALASANPVPPYSSWGTAAQTIQDAVDAATVPGALVLVTNGVYASGGRAVSGTMTNRVAADRPAVVRSVNGPAVTLIQGYQVPSTTNGDGAIRCVYLTNGAVLSGFTITNGATRVAGDTLRERCGGGVWCESTSALVTNCLLAANSAYSSGGGAFLGTLNNCTLTGNSALQYGGGAYYGTLNNCTLAGNSASQSGGGAYYGTLNNCTLTGNSALQYGGGAYYGTLDNCTLTGNSAQLGGGAYGGTVNNCMFMTNSASRNGGGASWSRLNNCTLTGNSTLGGGGGVDGGTVNNCVLTGNWAGSGGGAWNSTLNNCTLTGNWTTGDFNEGGGACNSTLNNCALTGNWSDQGGGVSGCLLNNCTLIANSARIRGGGASSGNLQNCIVYYNAARTGPNYYSSRLNYCCTTPLPGSGTGNISADPQLASTSQLSPNSPCRGAGSAAYATGVDIDGEPWLNPPSIGCDEYRAGDFTGALTVAIAASSTYVVPGFAVDLTGFIGGRVSASVWDFGDGTVLSNRPYASHSWSVVGDYPVILRAYNDTYPAGVSATVTVRVAAQPVHYVSAASANPVAPYDSWATAAQTLQPAADVAMPGSLVMVTNGVYATGGRAAYGTMTNRLAVGRAVTVRSVNGPAVTVIQGCQVPGTTNGDGAIRCVYLTNGAVLSGFTLTNGATRLAGYAQQEQSGGGVWCESTSPFVTNSALVINCLLAGNSAGRSGGGAYRGTLNNCTLTGNSALQYGGGASDGTLNNCILTGNSATGPDGSGGGARSTTLNNCIVYFNTAATGSNYSYGTLNYCCTTPLPGTGMGNITNPPLFVDQGNGNLRLQSTSPCINAGNNSYVIATTDLDGSPRIVSGTVDIGAYEFQGTGSVISYAWLQQYGLLTDGSADFIDSDHDGMDNWQEYLADTSPLEANDYLHITNFTRSGTYNTLWWTSKSTRLYQVERRESLDAASPWETTITNSAPGWNSVGFDNTGPEYFYRIRAVRP